MPVHCLFSSTKFYWNTAAPICLHIVLLPYMLQIELSSCNREHMVHKVSQKYLLSATTLKKFADSCLSLLFREHILKVTFPRLLLSELTHAGKTQHRECEIFPLVPHCQGHTLWQEHTVWFCSPQIPSPSLILGGFYVLDPIRFITLWKYPIPTHWSSLLTGPPPHCCVAPQLPGKKVAPGKSPAEGQRSLVCLLPHQCRRGHTHWTLSYETYEQSACWMIKSQQASLGGGQQGRRELAGMGGQGPGQTYLKHCLQQASSTALGPRGPLSLATKASVSSNWQMALPPCWPKAH